MIDLDSVDFSITRTSFSSGHICSIDYSYALRLDKRQYYEDAVYEVSVLLYGDDLFRDKPLGSPPYDTHTIHADEAMPVQRSFAMPCEVLDEALGEDKIFVKIQAISSQGDYVVERSETIHDWF